MTGGTLALVISTIFAGLAGLTAGIVAIFKGRADAEVSETDLVVRTLVEDYKRVVAERDGCRDALRRCEDG